MPATTSTEQVDLDKYKNVTVRKKKRQPRIEAEAQPSTATEEEMQLQIALGLSPEECKKADEMRKSDDARLQMALEESQKEADRLATTKQGTVSSGQLTQSALDDLLSLGVGELVSGNSDQPSSSGAWNSMGMADPLGVPQSSTPASAHTNDGLFTSSNNDPWATSAAPQPAASNSDPFAAWETPAASAPAATLTFSNSFDLLGGDLYIWIQEARGLPVGGTYFCNLMVGSHQDVETTRIASKDYVHWREGFEFRLTSKIDEIGVFLYRESDHNTKRALIGYAFLKGDHLFSKNLVEQWYPLHLSQLTESYVKRLGKQNGSQEAPSLRIKARWQSVDILPLRAYDTLLETLKTSYLPLCENLEPVLGVRDKEDVATLLVRIMYKQNLATEFLCDLIMKEVEKLDNDHLMFRGNTLATKAMESFMKLVAHDYLESTLSDFIKTVLQCEDSCEVDPQKVGNVSNSALERNRSLLMRYVEVAWTKILNNTHQLPRHLREVFSALRCRLEAQNRGALADTLISSSIFLRFLCPAILSPSLFNLVSEYPSPTNARNLTLIAKTLQNLANFSKFGGKEPHMEFMNEFVDREWLRMKDFLLQISTELKLPSDKGSEAVVDCGKELSLIATYLEEAWTPLLQEKNGNKLPLSNVKSILSELAECKRRPDNAIFHSPMIQQPSSDYENSPQRAFSFNFSPDATEDDSTKNDEVTESEPEEEVADEEEQDEPPLVHIRSVSPIRSPPSSPSPPTTPPTPQPSATSSVRKAQKAAKERARIQSYQQAAAPGCHAMSNRQRSAQEKFNGFLLKNGLNGPFHTAPTKTAIRSWKENAFVGLQSPLYTALFQPFFRTCGYGTELQMYKDILIFKKQRNENKRITLAKEIYDKFMHANAPQKVPFTKKIEDDVLAKLVRPPPRLFNVALDVVRDRIDLAHPRFIVTQAFNELEGIHI